MNVKSTARPTPYLTRFLNVPCKCFARRWRDKAMANERQVYCQATSYSTAFLNAPRKSFAQRWRDKAMADERQIYALLNRIPQRAS